MRTATVCPRNRRRGVRCPKLDTMDGDDPGTGSPEWGLAERGRALVDAVDGVVVEWLAWLVTERVRQSTGHVDVEIAADAAAEAESARGPILEELRQLLAADADDQRASPLDVLRRATRVSGAVLDRHGIPEVRRDAFARRNFPEDRHDLVPATWADIHPSLHEPGMAWGAAKAFVHLRRRSDAK